MNMERHRTLRVELIGDEKLLCENHIIISPMAVIIHLIAVIGPLFYLQVISARGHHIDAAKIKIIYTGSRQRVGALLRDHFDGRWQGKACQYRL